MDAAALGDVHEARSHQAPPPFQREKDECHFTEALFACGFEDPPLMPDSAHLRAGMSSAAEIARRTTDGKRRRLPVREIVDYH